MTGLPGGAKGLTICTSVTINQLNILPINNSTRSLAKAKDCRVVWARSTVKTRLS